MSKPPSTGPKAGAIAVISDAEPINRPIFEAGACSNTMLNISGRAIPVPTPCTSRPKSKSENCPAIAHKSVPKRKSTEAVTNSLRV